MEQQNSKHLLLKFKNAVLHILVDPSPTQQLQLRFCWLNQEPTFLKTSDTSQTYLILNTLITNTQWQEFSKVGFFQKIFEFDFEYNFPIKCQTSWFIFRDKFTLQLKYRNNQESLKLKLNSKRDYDKLISLTKQYQPFYEEYCMTNQYRKCMTNQQLQKLNAELFLSSQYNLKYFEKIKESSLSFNEVTGKPMESGEIMKYQHAVGFLKQHSITKIKNTLVAILPKNPSPHNPFISDDAPRNQAFIRGIKNSLQSNSKDTTFILKRLLQIMKGSSEFPKTWEDFRKFWLKKYQQKIVHSNIEDDEEYYLKDKFLQEFSKPSIFIRFFIYMYTAECLYKQLNDQIATYKYPFTSELTTLMVRGVKALMGSKVDSFPFPPSTLYRGIQTKSNLSKQLPQKIYNFTSLTSTSQNFQVAKKFSDRCQIITIKLMGEGQSCLGLSLKEWILNLNWDFIKDFVYYSYEKEYLIIPGFPFKVVEINGAIECQEKRYNILQTVIRQKVD